MEKKKTVIPNYEDDIFISYAHVDNDKYEDDHDGWVDKMHERLERRLDQLLGEKPAIWRDKKLNCNDRITITLMTRLQKIAILVAVLSPKYVNSEWCRKELQEFYRQMGESGRARFLESLPIFKVVKTPVPDDDYPEELRELLGFKFYDEDPDTGKPNEFSHEMKFDTFPKFIERINDLAWDIKRFIKTLQETPSGRLVPLTGRAVYLALTAGDLEVERDKIKRELQSRGHRVLPDSDFPSDAEKLRKVISEDLRKSDLSIHMIGKEYDGPQSLVRLQHELALERSREGKFAEVIWIPKGSAITDNNQQQLIDALRQDANIHPCIEILQEMLEDLKTNIHIKLKSVQGLMQQPLKTESPHLRTEDPLYLYLVNDDLDYEATTQLRNFLFDQNIEVLQIETREPNGEEKQTEALLQLRKDFTKDCNAVMIFQGQANDIWRGQKLSDLRKLKVGRSKPLLGKAIYLGAPGTQAKETFRSTELTVIQEEEKFPPQSLVSFVQQIKDLS